MLHSLWTLPGPGIEPVSPALAGRFLPTAPPGKACLVEYIRSVHLAGDTGGFPHSSVGKSSALLMQETRVRFLVQEDPPEKGNGNPLQSSCLEKPMDRGAWWSPVHGFARVGHDLATKPPPPEVDCCWNSFCLNCLRVSPLGHFPLRVHL